MISQYASKKVMATGSPFNNKRDIIKSKFINPAKIPTYAGSKSSFNNYDKIKSSISNTVKPFKNKIRAPSLPPKV